MTALLKGDCLKVMAGLPDKSVDCFVVDLPYGCLASPRATNGPGWRKELEEGKQKTLYRENNEVCAWDIKIDLVEFWKQIKRLCKNEHTPVLMFCNTKFGYELIASNPKWFRYDLVWDKGRGVSFLLANKQPMKSHEMIYIFSKSGSYYNRIDISGNDGTTKCPLSVIQIRTKHGNHPTEKPKELYKWLIERYCPKDRLVLDPTAGSFNSIIVAKELGLKAIGIEMDNDFFWKAVNRIETKLNDSSR